MDVHSARTHGTDQSMNTVEMMSLEIWPESNMSCRTACWNHSILVRIITRSGSKPGPLNEASIVSATGRMVHSNR